MFQYIVWAITFVTLWLTLIWLNFLFVDNKTLGKHSLPRVTFATAVWNEEKTILRTLKSLVAVDYPADKKQIIVVNDGSTDKTVSIIQEFIKTHKEVVLINKENGGKASALNVALKHSIGDFFAVMDADSRVEQDVLSHVLPNFEDKSVGAVISRIRVDEPKNFLQRMQRFEYVMSSLTRFVMNNFGTLSITHGACTVFNAKILRKVGGFDADRQNLTEDFEIALRLRNAGYQVRMEPRAISYTHVPSTPKTVWKQRTRWSRGYIYNMWNYRSMIFNQKHGLLGTFQLPVNVLAVGLLILNVSLISYDAFDRSWDFVSRSITLDGYFWTQITSWPTIKQFVLARNVQITLPIFITFLLGVYLMYSAHRLFKERISHNIMPLVAYTLVMPYFSAMNWISSIAKEVRKSKRTWR